MPVLASMVQPAASEPVSKLSDFAPHNGALLSDAVTVDVPGCTGGCLLGLVGYSHCVRPIKPAYKLRQQ